MIISKNIKLKTKFPINNEYIETRFEKINIKPLRWAIVKISSNEIIISASIEI